MKLINLTPHTICVVNDENIVIDSFPASGTVARIQATAISGGNINGIEIVRNELGAISGLPEPAVGTYYLVSMPVAQECRDRGDVIAPDTGPSALRENGQIVGVRRFCRY